MTTKQDIELLEKAKHAAGFLLDDVREIHAKTENLFLAEHAYELLMAQVKINQKIERLLSLAEMENTEVK